MSGTRVYISGLVGIVERSHVAQFFEGYGRIREIVIKDGFAFVDFYNQQDANAAVDNRNGMFLLGFKVLVAKVAAVRKDVNESGISPSSNACRNCGKDGHYAIDCPIEKKSSAIGREVKREFRHKTPSVGQKTRAKWNEAIQWQMDGKTIEPDDLQNGVQSCLDDLLQMELDLSLAGRPADWCSFDTKLNGILPSVREVTQKAKGFMKTDRLSELDEVEAAKLLVNVEKIKDLRDELVVRVKPIVNNLFVKLVDLYVNGTVEDLLDYVYTYHPPDDIVSRVEGMSLAKQVCLAIYAYQPSKQEGKPLEWRVKARAIAYALKWANTKIGQK